MTVGGGPGLGTILIRSVPVPHVCWIHAFPMNIECHSVSRREASLGQQSEGELLSLQVTPSFCLPAAHALPWAPSSLWPGLGDPCSRDYWSVLARADTRSRCRKYYTRGRDLTRHILSSAVFFFFF